MCEHPWICRNVSRRLNSANLSYAHLKIAHTVGIKVTDVQHGVENLLMLCFDSASAFTVVGCIVGLSAGW